MAMTLRASPLGLIGSMLMWGVWLAFSSDNMDSVGVFYAVHFSILFAIADVLALKKTVMGKG